MTEAPPPRPGDTAAARVAEGLEASAVRDAALVALATGIVLGLAVGDALVALPQAAAALYVAVARPRPRPLGGPLRVLLVLASVAYAFGPPGDALRSLARFLAAMAAVTLVEGRRGRERGFLLLLCVIEAGLATALVPGFAVFVFLVATTVLVQRALGSLHRARAASAVAAKGGAIVGPLDARPSRRAAHRGAVAVLALGAAIFPILPRSELPLFAWRAPRDAGAVGVGDEIRLRALGTLGDLDAVVGRAEPPPGVGGDEPPYLRAAAFDAFDGTSWRSSSTASHAIPMGPEAGRVDLRRAFGHGRPVAWRLHLVAAAAERLPLPERAVALEFDDPRPEAVYDDESIGAVRVRLAPFARALDAVAFDATGPLPAAPLDAREATTLLAVPSAVREEVGPLVREALRDVPPGRATADALVAWIRARCAYSLTGAPSGRTPVQDFLVRERRGHCEYFASALAVCLRCAGIPARVAAGYMPTRWNAVGGFWTIRRRDAHAWVEAHLPGEGWARFDAVPAADLEPDPYEGFVGFFVGLRDAAERLWSSSVLGFDRGAQADLLASLAAAARDALARARGSLRAAPAWGVVGGALGALAFAALVVRTVRRRRGGAPSRLGGRGRVGFYRAALAHLEADGWRRRPSESPREILAARGPTLPAGGTDALREVTEAFERVRYGEREAPSPGEVERWLEALDASDR